MSFITYDEKERYYAKTRIYRRTNRKWKDEEIQLILEHKVPDRELSKQLKRSMEAIQVKRCVERKKQNEYFNSATISK